MNSVFQPPPCGYPGDGVRLKSAPRGYPGNVAAPTVPYHLHEDEVVRRWFALPSGTSLPLSDGGSCQLVFHGRKGSAAGPDVQDAVLRFEQKADAFVEQLHHNELLSPLFSANAACLIIALAEGLGYGRDRAFFRAAGAYLLGCAKTIPEPLGHTFDPPALVNSRLVALRTLVARWREKGAWETLKKIILPPGESVLYIAIITGLRTVFAEVGRTRADILICNCQQGLHYIYQQTCREKHCEVWMLGERLL